MKVTYHTDPFPFILIDNYYSKEEETLIKKELDFFLPSLKGPDHTGTATDPETGEALKNNKGIFLDEVFTDRNLSYILNINRKTFGFLEEAKDQVGYDNWFFKNQETNTDTTLISYYESGDHYKKHKDYSLYTVLTWFYKKPRSFVGGNLFFPDYDLKVKCKNNRFIVFPSMIRHAVEDVKVDDDKLGQGYGRWCLTQFATSR